MIWVATGAMTTVLLAALGFLSFWVSRSLDAVERHLSDRIDRVDTRLDRIEGTVLRDHGERIARLESR